MKSTAIGIYFFRTPRKANFGKRWIWSVQGLAEFTNNQNPTKSDQIRPNPTKSDQI